MLVSRMIQDMTVVNTKRSYACFNSNPFPSSIKNNKRETATATTRHSLLFPQHNISVLCFTLYLSLSLSQPTTQQSMYAASTMKSMYKPPLPRSPIRLRPSHAVHSSNSIALQTPPGSFSSSSSSSSLSCNLFSSFFINLFMFSKQVP